MKVHTLQRYGLRAMIEIALDEEQRGVLQKHISDRQKISLRYLDHIIRGLKTASLIRNKAGRKSGYILARPASSISVLNIMNAFQSDVLIVDCIDPGIECELKTGCITNRFWGGLNNRIKDYLQETTLQALVNQYKDLNSKTTVE
ncbi:Iron-sulfur cluster regulator IscR [hydrothermal vent metagenome]|uniref:Iron-sulfur cluster regulator IscR n=1 Tax=hydrothermal vent metagenome TaxID=652676 RepID=A0A3B0UW96_9ZZZZ